ncbi:MAG: pyridoxal-dependent decarboxylase [Pseudomonadota bacterium]
MTIFISDDARVSNFAALRYDAGFAIIRDEAAHMRAMAMDAGCLNQAPEDGRNSANYRPELSRRAHGFAAWAVIRALGRAGIQNVVRSHCDAAGRFAGAFDGHTDLEVLNPVTLNQVALGARQRKRGADPRPRQSRQRRRSIFCPHRAVEIANRHARLDHFARCSPCPAR